jgi:hypothetical protein
VGSTGNAYSDKLSLYEFICCYQNPFNSLKVISSLKFMFTLSVASAKDHGSLLHVTECVITFRICVVLVT